MDILEQSGTGVVPLGQVRGTTGAVALTFDDGYKNFLDQALEPLLRHGFPATVFVVTGFCGRSAPWLSRARRSLELMGWSEIRTVAQSGVEIGAHTVTHRNLTRVPESQLLPELRDCQSALEEIAGEAVRSFAYPYGTSTPKVRGLVRQLYQRACGTLPGYVSESSDPFDLPRIDACLCRNPRWFRALLQPGGRAYIGVRRLLRMAHTSLSWRQADNA
jgi:peptidoglycan/xylan/chitin deacetylase (PgdA/CDA1 family)